MVILLSSTKVDSLKTTNIVAIKVFMLQSINTYLVSDDRVIQAFFLYS